MSRPGIPATDLQTDYAAREIANVVVLHFNGGGSTVEFAEPQDIPQMAREVERSLGNVVYHWPNVQRLAVQMLGQPSPGREAAWTHGDRTKMVVAVVTYLKKIHSDGAMQTYAVCIGSRSGTWNFGVDKAVLSTGKGDVSDCRHIERVDAPNPAAARALGWERFTSRRLSVINSQQEVLIGQVTNLFDRAGREVGQYGAPLTARRSIVVNDRLANDTYGYLALSLYGGMAHLDPAEGRLMLGSYFHVDPNIFRQLHPEFEPLAKGLTQIGERVWMAVVDAGFRDNNSRGEVARNIVESLFRLTEITLHWGTHAPWAMPATAP